MPTTTTSPADDIINNLDVCCICGTAAICDDEMCADCLSRSNLVRFDGISLAGFYA